MQLGARALIVGQRLCILTCLLSSGSVAVAAEKPLAVYVSPHGDDTNDGRTPRTPVHSFKAVQDRLRQAGPAALSGGVDVLLRPGTYYDVSVEWTFSLPGLSVSVLPQPDASGSTPVVFDGSQGPGRAFFNFDPSRADDPKAAATMHFRLDGLQVQNYCEGISFGGPTPQSASQGHTVTHNTLRNIGSKYDRRMRSRDGKRMPSGDCVAAIRLSDTSNTTVSDNRFENIENLDSGSTYYRKYGPALMHAIYISTRSRGSSIVDNVFDGFTGSPVRIRDRSDDTVVKGNTFRRPIQIAGLTDKEPIHAVSEWYCNVAVPSCLELARAGAIECPSKQIVISGNHLEDNVAGFEDESQSKQSTCDLDSKR